MFTKIMQEYRAGTGAYDALNVIPSWMPDLAMAGALEPLDAYVDKYGYREELQTIAPTYRDNQMTFNDTIYRSEEHTSELQSLMRISYAVFCLKKKSIQHTH